MTNKIKRLSESLFPEVSINFPEQLSLYTSNGNFTYQLRNVYNDGLSIKATYSAQSDEIEFEYLPIEEPSNLYLELSTHTNEEGQQKFTVDIVYGKSQKFNFSIQRPDLLQVTGYNGFGSKFDGESKFSFSDISIKDFVKCLNEIGFEFTEKHFQFMDKYPYSYQYYESLDLKPLFGGSVLIINNGQPNRRSYLPNVLNYLNTRGIKHLVTSSVTEVDTILATHDIIGVISTGSDYRISSQQDDSEQALSHRVLGGVNVPLIGMCYGFQSMANFYGAPIKDSGHFFHDNIKIDNWDRGCKIFKDFNLDDFQFSVSFHDVVTKCPANFKVIAQHQGNILGIENQQLMRWGLAFHPEDIERTYPVLDNFIDICIEQRGLGESKVIKFGEFIQINIL